MPSTSNDRQTHDRCQRALRTTLPVPLLVLLAACGSRYELGAVRQELDLAHPTATALVAQVIVDEPSDGDAELPTRGLVAGIGDVNGDGFADWMRAPRTQGDRLGQQLTYGAPRLPDVGFVASDGPVLSTPSSAAVALQALPAGDLNGDGFADVIWSSLQQAFGQPEDETVWSEVPRAAWSGLPEQRSFLVYGSPDLGTGELSLPEVAVTFEPLALGLDAFEARQSAEPDTAAEGFIANQHIDLASLGDLDADGFDDFAYSYSLRWRGARMTPTGGFVLTDQPERVEATTYVFYGGPEQLAGSALSARAAELPGVVTLTALGDVDGDGFPELAAQLDNGLATLIAGGPARFSGAVAAVEIGERLDAAVVEDGATAQVVIQALGDIDGDGLADVSITHSQIGGPGMAYLFYGSEDRVSIPFFADFADAAFVVASLEGQLGTLTPLGDWNGDGYTDLLSSFTPAHDAAPSSGAKFRDAAVVIPGSATRYDGVYSPPAPEADASGENPGALQELSAQPIGDVDGDGMADVQFNVPRGVTTLKFGGAFSPDIIY